jgi:selenocysteine lyase/cysteine desulfurase
VPELAAAGCYAAVRGEMLRLAPHLHVSDADVERLASALARILGAGGG